MVNDQKCFSDRSSLQKNGYDTVLSRGSRAANYRKDQRDDEYDQKDEKEDFGNLSRYAFNPSKSENRCNDRDDQKYECPS